MYRSNYAHIFHFQTDLRLTRFVSLFVDGSFQRPCSPSWCCWPAWTAAPTPASTCCSATGVCLPPAGRGRDPASAAMAAAHTRRPRSPPPPPPPPRCMTRRPPWSAPPCTSALRVCQWPSNQSSIITKNLSCHLKILRIPTRVKVSGKVRRGRPRRQIFGAPKDNVEKLDVCYVYMSLLFCLFFVVVFIYLFLRGWGRGSMPQGPAQPNCPCVCSVGELSWDGSGIAQDVHS